MEGLPGAYQVEFVKSSLEVNTAYVILFLPLAYAGLVHLLYRRGGRRYGEHIVFALNLHSFGLLTVTAMALARSDTITMMLAGVLFVYQMLALKRVYGGPYLVAAAKGAAITAGYALALRCGGQPVVSRIPRVATGIAPLKATIALPRRFM